MEYTVEKLARLSGVSARTLRYYDELGLLRPARVASNGYRIYGQKEVDRLHEILFYRALGMPLGETAKLLDAPGYDRVRALEAHLETLRRQQEQLRLLTENGEKTLRAWKGETSMTDKEKFEGLRQKRLDENEEKYGAELRERYGEETVEDANRCFSNMTEDQWNRAEALRAAYQDALQKAFAQGDPAGEDARRACELHGQWLRLFWKEGAYSKATHRAMGEMYAADERFAAYYERLAPGCALFFRDALAAYCKE